MEPTRNELQLVSNMIMCGDHPSITKTELNVKETKPKDEDKDKENEDVKKFISYGRISPTSSHTDKLQGLQELRARRRARSLELAERADVDVQGNRALVQAAVGSFRWPPYLLCVWVLVLVLTHALHCLVAVLERALPTLRKFCQYFRAWTEASWRGAGQGAGAGPGAGALGVALAGATGALYALYAALYVLLAAAVWAVEPLCADVDALAAFDVPRVTDYDDIDPKLVPSAKQ